MQKTTIPYYLQCTNFSRFYLFAKANKQRNKNTVIHLLWSSVFICIVLLQIWAANFFIASLKLQRENNATWAIGHLYRCRLHTQQNIMIIVCWCHNIIKPALLFKSFRLNYYKIFTTLTNRKRLSLWFNDALWACFDLMSRIS